MTLNPKNPTIIDFGILGRVACLESAPCTAANTNKEIDSPLKTRTITSQQFSECCPDFDL
jgi:hypothetical protein